MNNLSNITNYLHTVQSNLNLMKGAINDLHNRLNNLSNNINNNDEIAKKVGDQVKTQLYNVVTTDVLEEVNKLSNDLKKETENAFDTINKRISDLETKLIDTQSINKRISELETKLEQALQVDPSVAKILSEASLLDTTIHTQPIDNVDLTDNIQDDFQIDIKSSGKTTTTTTKRKYTKKNQAGNS